MRFDDIYFAPEDGLAESQHVFLNGIGAPESRVASVNAWQREAEPNIFGTNEFLELCKSLDCGAGLTCNAATASVKAAQAWAKVITTAVGL